MKKSLLILSMSLILMTLLAQAQMPLPPRPILPGSQSWPMYVAVEANVLWQKTSINLHGDQLGLNGTRGIGEFGLTVMDPLRWRLKISTTTQQNGGDCYVPTGPLSIGSTDFIKAETKAIDIKPVQVDWTIGPSHRLELVLLSLNTTPRQFWFQPAIVGEWINLSVKGSKDDNGKIISDTETFRQFFPAVGVEVVYQDPSIRLVVLGAASDKYSLVEANYRWFIADNIEFAVGYQAKTFKLLRDTALRSQGLGVGVNWRW